jgi:Ca-activated chloride channel family protein
MFNRGVFENSRDGGVGVLQIVELPSRAERQAAAGTRFVPLKRTELSGQITGPLASLTVRHVYGYTREQCAATLEAAYRFPLPGDAAVTGVRVRFGEVEIATELKEREEASREYEQARDEGRQAALLSREAPDVFTLQVTGLRPDEDIVVETSYVQRARAQGDGWSLRVPLTTAPRYTRGDERESPAARGQPLAVLRDPGHRFRLDVVVENIDSTLAVTSPTHRLRVTREAGDAERGRVRVQFTDGDVVPDRDCVLAWRPPRRADRPALQVLLHDDAVDDRVYFLALATPPAEAPERGVPREVILLVDHSGSMEGPKWEAADWAVERFLSDLTPRDHFALGLFHSTTRWLARTLRAGTRDHVADAIEFLKAHRDSGGTELGVALEQALAIARTKGTAARHVLVITDAQVTDAGRLLRLAEEERSRADARRISVLCIDAAPNAALATELAERGGGVARFLTSSPEADDITTALDDVLAEWGAPVEASLRLVVNRAGADAVGRTVARSVTDERSEIDLGDLPAGRPVWVVGRALPPGHPELTFALVTANRTIAAERFAGERAAAQAPGVRALFGADRLVRLERLATSYRDAAGLREGLRRLGYDPEEVMRAQEGTGAAVYAENVLAQAQAALRALLVRESLAFGLPTSATAFVAVRRERGLLAELREQQAGEDHGHERQRGHLPVPVDR